MPSQGTQREKPADEPLVVGLTTRAKENLLAKIAEQALMEDRRIDRQMQREFPVDPCTKRIDRLYVSQAFEKLKESYQRRYDRLDVRSGGIPKRYALHQRG
jgi:hypothetical protein